MRWSYLSMMETMSLTRFDRKNGLPSGSRPQNNAQNDPWRTAPNQRLANLPKGWPWICLELHRQSRRQKANWWKAFCSTTPPRRWSATSTDPWPSTRMSGYKILKTRMFKVQKHEQSCTYWHETNKDGGERDGRSPSCPCQDMWRWKMFKRWSGVQQSYLQSLMRTLQWCADVPLLHQAKLFPCRSHQRALCQSRGSGVSWSWYFFQSVVLLFLNWCYCFIVSHYLSFAGQTTSQRRHSETPDCTHSWHELRWTRSLKIDAREGLDLWISQSLIG